MTSKVFKAQRFVYCGVQHVMVQPWDIGVCWIDQVFVTELSVVIFFFVHTAVLSIKTVFNLVKIHLLLCIILLIQWSVIFCRPCCYRFRRLKYTPSVFRIYADIHDWRTNENLCNKLNPYPLTNLAATGNSCFRLVDF
jgi:hypothetical protein